MVPHVADLVHLAALHDGTFTEDVAYRLADALAAVDHAQDRLIHLETTTEQILQQLGANRRVLGRPLPEPQREFGPVARHAKRDDDDLLGDLDAIEKERDEVDLLQAALEKAVQLLGRLRDQCPTRRALAGAEALDLRRQRIETALVASSRHTQHDLLGHALGQRVGRAEHLDCGQLRFAAILASYAWTLHDDLSPTERQRRRACAPVVMRAPR